MTDNAKTTNETKLSQWNNNDNSAFHEKVGKTLQEWAIKGGLEHGCDIDIIYPYIANRGSIMEIGASYGRVIGNILARNYKGKIFAIERSVAFYSQLLSKFKNKKNVFLVNADIQTYAPNSKVDAILMLWSFISEFPKQDQLPLLKQVASWLNPNGIIILETILHTSIPSNSNFSSGQDYIIPFEDTNCYGYATSAQEIKDYAKQLGVKKIMQINYKTDIQKDRILHILSL